MILKSIKKNKNIKPPNEPTRALKLNYDYLSN